MIVGQLILTNVLMPLVMSRELGINPLLVLFAVLLGGKIYGVVGILFAIPAAAIIATVVGKAVNRYLLPAYERPGWWREEVIIAEVLPADSGDAPVEHPATLSSRPAVTPVTPAAPSMQETS